MAQEFLKRALANVTLKESKRAESLKDFRKGDFWEHNRAYKQWNDALAKRFFNLEHAGCNVYLYVNQDLINQMENQMPDVGTFRIAVVGSLTAKENVCRQALQTLEAWRIKDLQFPPYIGYLGFFVLAADIDGDYAPNAYYPRLWQLLIGERRGGQIPWFNRMWQLWEDLERWTMDDQQGKLGIFQARPIGGYVHVGYPISQSLLVERERRGLPRIFYDAGLDPTTNHPLDELAQALRQPIARQLLRAKTVRLAEKPQDTSLHTALLEAVASELGAWDGIVMETIATPTRTTSMFAGLRICIDLDRIAGIAKTYIRCKLNREFPENGLIIAGEFEAREAGNGWSLPVKNSADSKTVDASTLDWYNGETIKSDSHGWQMTLPSRKVRIFVQGISEGISSLIEIYALPQGQSFYLAYPATTWRHLQKWATTQCCGFQEINIVEGLPDGWLFAEFQSAVEDEAIGHVFPMLSFTANARLQTLGGIRNGRGNNFFSFAPPDVLLTGGSQNTEVYCDGQLLSTGKTDGIFNLPTDLPKETRISLEAREGQAVQCRLSLFLTGDFSPIADGENLWLDSAGNSIQRKDGEPTTAGVYVHNKVSKLIVIAAELFEDWTYEMGVGGMRGFLIGQQPGQIVAWPSETFPYTWIPTWAIKEHGKKRWYALFVGKVFSNRSPENPVVTPTRREVRNWKTVVWHRRKCITPPRERHQRVLWHQLQETARNVR